MCIAGIQRSRSFMSYCPECGRPLLVRQKFCLKCSRDRDANEDGLPEEDPSAAAASGDLGLDRVMIARFQNGAEAGYFADELTRAAAIETEVLARERFDGVHAAWSVDYILLVDRPHAERAARLLQSLVEATGGDAEGDATDESSRSDVPGGVWVPLILTLAAGSIACFGIERVDHRARPPALVLHDRRDASDLWTVLAATRGTWTQTLEGGPGVRELTLDPETDSASLKEDLDGDGRFDREWDFSFRQR
jgi:hypothetical protein